MKKLILIVLTIYLILANGAIAVALQTLIYVNGERLNLPLEPIIESGVTLVPMRPIFEALDADVSWDSRNNEVKASKGDITIKLPMGKKVGIINGYIHDLAIPTKMVNNYTLVPLRFISESLGAAVDWDKESGVITINTIDISQAPKTSFEEVLSIPDLAKKAKHVVMIMTFDSYENLTATASGVVIGPGGLVVTNYHVIAGTSEALIVNDNEETFPVQGVLAFDEERDLALLKVEGDLPYVDLGDSDFVQKGDTVISIGSPLGIKNTVSNGVVSNLVEIEGKSFIQTTAPISEGSSGGALFNSRGELIGVTTAFVAQGQSISLAIPINELKPLILNLPDKPLALDQIFLDGSTAYEEAVSIEDLVSYLTQYHSNYGEGNSPINFTYLPSENNLYDYEIEALIDPLHYGNWLEISNKEKLAIIGTILKGIDANVDLSKSFRIVFFYQDYWPFYPSSFEEQEVTPAPDGGKWLVTHIIAQGYTSEDELKWEVFY